MNAPRLIGDIGGTNARFAIAQDGQYGQLKHVETEQYPSLHDALADYLKARPHGELSGALAIAGPVLGDRISLTNKAWSFSVEDLKRSLHLSVLTVVNDFAATAQSIPYLSPLQKFVIGPAIANPNGNVGIVGPGTGLGMSSLIPNGPDGDGWTLVAGEGGHATLAASTEEEFAIIQMLRKRWSHVSAERVLSGAGLVNLYEALCALRDIEPLMLAPADVTRRAMDKSDEVCIRAFAHFCEFLGSVAGDLALTVGAFGGVYIAGGILPRFKEAFAASAFRERFEAKGRFASMLAKMPTWLILDESPALIGLANMPLEVKSSVKK